MPNLLHGLSALLAPDRCTACGDRGRQPWCGRCAAQAGPLRILRSCDRCGAGPGAHGCWPPDAPVSAGLSAYRYRGVVASAVVAGKARGATAVWPALGEHLADAVRRADLAGPDVVTWVPTDPRRVRERSVDHAEVLARRVAAALGASAARLLTVAMRRPDQALLPEVQRRRVPDGAFRPARALRGGAILLVDDVVTTGGTAHAAAGALRRAGAGRVTLATLARAGDHRLGRRGPT